MFKNHKSVAMIMSIFAILLFVLTGCGQNSTPAPAETQKPEAEAQPAKEPVKEEPVETKKLNIAMLKLTSSAPLFIGIEKGFFKEHGVELEVEWFQAAQPIAVATATNKVDVGATGITAGLYNMVAGGQKLAIVADKGREQQGYSSSAVLVTQELYDQGIQSIADLKGKKVGITQTGSTFHYMMARALEENGLSPEDVELVPLTKLSALMESLKSKQVDAVILNEPNITKVEKEGYGKVIAQIGDIMEYQTSAIFLSPELIEDKETAIRFLKGYIQSTRYYYDALLTKKDGTTVPGENFDEVVKIISDYTGAPAEDIKVGVPYMDRDGKLLAEDIQTQIDWYLANKLMEQPVEASEIVDTELWEEALKQLQ